MTEQHPTHAGDEGRAWCGVCRYPLQLVRPGKYQCPHCELRESLDRTTAARDAARRWVTKLEAITAQFAEDLAKALAERDEAIERAEKAERERNTMSDLARHDRERRDVAEDDLNGVSSELRQTQRLLAESRQACRTVGDKLRQAEAEAARLLAAAIQGDHEVQQILGKALGCSWYKDDPRNFPSATEADGVCTGDSTGASLALEAVRRLARLEEAARHIIDVARHGIPVTLIADLSAAIEQIREALEGKGDALTG